MPALTVATTILQQLGGNRFIAMTGAHNIGGGRDHLIFRVMKNTHNVNAVRILLNGLDLYDINFYKVQGSSVTIVHHIENVYAEDLQTVFTSNTGLDTNL